MRLEVNPSELEGLAHGLWGLLGDLQLAGEIRSISPAAAESPRLQAAIERLVVRWSDDIDDIRAQLERLSGRASSAGVEYEGVERRVRDDVALTPAVQVEPSDKR